MVIYLLMGLLIVDVLLVTLLLLNPITYVHYITGFGGGLAFIPAVSNIIL